jgi:hypothetical protein
VVVAAALAVVIAMAVAFALGLDDRGDDGGGSASPSPSSGGASSAAPSQDADQPTAEGMKSFIGHYIDTAVHEPTDAFAMLTPEFQAESKGLKGYEKFWGKVHSAKILSIEADPDTLVVHYRYTYVEKGGPRTDDVTLQLVYDDGTYLIDGEA